MLFAGDAALVAHPEEQMQHLVNKLSKGLSGFQPDYQSEEDPNNGSMCQARLPPPPSTTTSWR